jgi:phosphatidylglycerol:prolipoprotein diacylglycerol transferase
VHPVLFTVGPFALRSYGLLLALSFFLGILLAGRRVKRMGGDPAKVVDLAVVIIVASIIGSRFLYVIFHWREFAGSPLEIINPFSNPQGIGIAGLSMDGGLVLAVVAGLLFLRLTKQPVLATLDALAPSFALGIILTRIGCFLNGCCFGTPCSGPLCVVFPEDSLAGWIYPHTPLHPAQLYNALGGLIMLVMLLRLERHKTFSGFTFFLALVFYGLLRGLVDFFRHFEAGVILFRVAKLPITINQGISLVMMILALIFFLRFRSRGAMISPDRSSGGRRFDPRDSGI